MSKQIIFDKDGKQTTKVTATINMVSLCTVVRALDRIYPHLTKSNSVSSAINWAVEELVSRGSGEYLSFQQSARWLQEHGYINDYVWND